jgi:ComEC/Rec2-related protein
LASGFLIGDTRDIPTDIYNRFRDSGTLHLLAVSGSNVGLVVVMFIFLLRASPMKHRSKTILLLLIIFIFSNLAFNQPSVIRAAIMASLILIGKYLQRRIDLNNIIALTALIILLVKPTELFDVGFQLSFTTAWGLIFLLPVVIRFFQPIQNRLYYKFLIFPFLICMVAQLVSLPMSAYYFQRMPMISFISNLIVVPLVSIIVIGSLILLLTSLILPLLGSIVGSLLNPLISATLYFIRQFGSEKLSVLLQHQVTGVLIILFYILLIMLSFSIVSKRARRLTLLYLFIAANGLVISGLMSGGEDSRFTIFSLSRGIVSVNQGPQSQVVLCNLPLKEYLVSEKIIEPYLANRQIKNPDLVALSVGHQTIKEASYLYKTNNRSKLYLPRASRCAFMDIYSTDTTVYDTIRIGFYDSMSASIDPEKADIILSNGLLLYVFDSSMILFLSNARGVEVLSGLPSVNEKEMIIIKPFITKEDLSYFFDGMAHHNIRAIICNKTNWPERPLISGELKESENIPRIIQTSQSGAVELIIRKGAIWRLK